MYTTLTNAKERLGITINAYDDFITRLIKSATKLIARYISRDIEYKVLNYKAEGNDEQVIKSLIYPLKEIINVKINEQDVTDECEIDNNSRLFIYRERGFPKKRLYSEWSFGNTTVTRNFLQRNVELELSGGYILPQEFESDFPEDIENICLDLVATYFTNSSIEAQVSSENYSSDSYSFSKSYAKLDKSLTLNELQKSTLLKYKEMI
jgi:hypothetical protein